MRIYNGTQSKISIPWLGTNNPVFELEARTVSGNFMPTNEFLTLLTNSFTPDQIAFIIAGRCEYEVCANVKMAANYTVTSLDEAIDKCTPKKKAEPVEEIIKEEEKQNQEAEPEVEVPCENEETETNKEEENAESEPETPEPTVKKSKKSKK